MGGVSTAAHLGSAAPALAAALAQASADRVVARLWDGDHTLWKPDPTEISNRLGWLTISDAMRAEIPRLNALAKDIRTEGVRDVVLLGMGGSSLGPEVLRATLGSARGYPRLWVLDSTVPGWVRAVTRAIRPSHTLFLVASKSGGTIEVMSLLAHFEALVKQVTGHGGGAQFVAITDPGTSLSHLASARRFRALFENPSNIGGRYSVLSFFGLVPAALIGIDIDRLVQRAEAMAETCRTDHPLSENPGAYLGLTLSALARQGRDKVTLLTSPALRSFGLWAEQLLAESTGKNGKGLIPVADEPLARPSVYGSDRVFVYLRLKGDSNAALDKQAKAFVNAGHPLVELPLQDRYDLGAEFFRWEFATAIAGHALGIHPFDQPNVQESKDNTRRILEEFQKSGRLPQIPTVSPREAVPRLLSRCTPGSYVGILAYMQATTKIDAALRQIRRRLLAQGRVATTAGYGPRYLHSTGQVHKGGPPCGLFLQLLETPTPDVPVPGQRYTFGTLAQAQAIGDVQALQSRDRPVVQVRLGSDPLTALRTLGRTLTSPKRRTRTVVRRARGRPVPRRRRTR